MGTPERRSDLRVHVDFEINYHTQVLVHLNLPTRTVDTMRDTIFELMGATGGIGVERLLPFAEEIDRKSRKRRIKTYKEILTRKYDDAKKAEENKREADKLSDRTILDNLKPDLAEELADVRLADSPHQAYLASACRKIMVTMNRTFFTGKETDTVKTSQDPDGNPYL